MDKSTTYSPRLPLKFKSSMSCSFTAPLSLPPHSRTNSIISGTSSSLMPRKSTILSFTGLRPASTAAKIPSSTFWKFPLVRVMKLYFSSFSVSRLTFTRRSPAAASSFAYLRRSTPFVVMETSLSPSGSDVMISTISDRIKGSPPENLTLRTPKCLSATLTIADMISALISFLESDGSPSLWQ
ncbi:MAG: hypothetical protein OD814_001419 [Candidatus Alkanophagales archaeon MCA70_species_1]|nr:hypothetical protein [Candidatus Alkanophaga volatiphilum]